MENSAPILENPSEKCSIKILTFTPVWRRPEIFKIMLKGLERLIRDCPDTMQIQPFFIVSESTTARFLLQKGYDFLFTQNEPLGNKKNLGIRYALDNFDFDYILEIGSDDLISSDYLQYVYPYLQKGTAQIHPEDVHFLNSETGETAYWKPNNIIGLGRFISRKALKKTLAKRNFIWEPENNRGLDSSSWKQLRICGYDTIPVPTHGRIYTLDVKSPTNINPMNHFTPRPVNPEILSKIFPEISDILKKSRGFSCKKSI